MGKVISLLDSSSHKYGISVRRSAIWYQHRLKTPTQFAWGYPSLLCTSSLSQWRHCDWSRECQECFLLFSIVNPVQFLSHACCFFELHTLTVKWRTILPLSDHVIHLRCKLVGVGTIVTETLLKPRGMELYYICPAFLVAVQLLLQCFIPKIQAPAPSLGFLSEFLYSFISWIAVTL